MYERTLQELEAHRITKVLLEGVVGGQETRVQACGGVSKRGVYNKQTWKVICYVRDNILLGGAPRLARTTAWARGVWDCRVIIALLRPACVAATSK